MSHRTFFTALFFLAVFPLLSLPAVAQQGFGKSVLIDDGEIYVGEPDNLYRAGAVHVFAREGTTWTQTGEITAPGAEMGDHFGSSIDIDGDQMVVGSTGPDGQAGEAHVYRRLGADWQFAATLTAPDLEDSDRFGAAVALSGVYAFVGAPADDDAPGSVHVYLRNGDAWTHATTLTGGGAGNGSAFGSAIVVDGGHAYVGAPGLNDEAGGVYVYNVDAASGTWSESRLLEGRVTGTGDRYGSALDVRNDELIVGVPRFGNRVGGAIVYARSPETDEWESTSLLLPYAAANAPGFGAAVALTDSEVWVGAPTGRVLHGSAYRFSRMDDGSFGMSTMIPASDTERGDFFGRSLDVEGSLGIVGLQGDDYGAGSVAVYELGGDGQWTQTSRLRSSSTGLQAITGDMINCDEGAASMFSCDMVDLLSFLPISSLGGVRGVQLNDIWGWTDPATNREYALVGRVDGTSFVDVTDPSNPLFLGDLPMTEGARGSAWRDVKVYRNHAFIVADNAGEHGMQVFDLTQLRDVVTPRTFEPSTVYTMINSAHNIVINTDTGFAYTVGNGGGGETCGGGLHMINVQDPMNPTFAGCYAAEGTGRAGTGYTHDAQCLIYDGPDSEHVGRELCFGSNETALNIADVTDKENPVSLSTASYPNVSYTHQGWISQDHRYFYVNDELDEISGNVTQTRTLIWDVTDVDDPQLVKEYMWGSEASDHNLYVHGNLMYQSNYVSGLRIHDISDPVNPREVGYFDTMPVGDNSAGFAGSWSNYPFFDSGTIVVSSIGEGLFVLRKKKELGL